MENVAINVLLDAPILRVIGRDNRFRVLPHQLSAGGEHAPPGQFKPGAGEQPAQDAAGAGFVQRIRRDNDVSKLFGHSLGRRRRLGRFGYRCYGWWRRRFAPQNLKHDGAAGRALAFDGPAPVFHGFFNSAYDFLLGFAFDAVSFGHRKMAASTRHAPLQLCEYLMGRLSPASTGKRPVQVSLPRPAAFHCKLQSRSNLRQNAMALTSNPGAQDIKEIP